MLISKAGVVFNKGVLSYFYLHDVSAWPKLPRMSGGIRVSMCEDVYRIANNIRLDFRNYEFRIAWPEFSRQSELPEGNSEKVALGVMTTLV